MKVYEIFPYDNDDILCVVLPTSHFEPLREIESLAIQLKSNFDMPGYIILDYILSAGNTKSRYAKVFFNNEGFVKSSYEVIELDKKDIIRGLISEFLKSQQYYLEYSTLTSTQQKLIRNGRII